MCCLLFVLSKVETADDKNWPDKYLGSSKS